MSRFYRRSMVGCLAVAAALVMATSCSANGDSASSESGSGSASALYPVALNNCGRTITVKAEPKRVVSLWQSTTEALLALGLRDRIVAVQKNYAPYPASVAGAAQGLKDIGSSMAFPSKEVLLSERPDFVTGQVLDGFAFDASQGYATVKQVEQSGAAVYGANLCTSADAQDSAKWNVDTTATTLRDLGRIFGVEGKADALVARLNAQKQDVIRAVAGKPTVRTAYFNGGEGPVIVLAGGIYDSLITTAGGSNAFPSNSVYVSKEAFAASDADVILVGTYDGQDFATQKAFLQRTFPNVPAVRNGRISEVPTQQTDSSISIMVGLTKTANALHPGLDLPVPSS